MNYSVVLLSIMSECTIPLSSHSQIQLTLFLKEVGLPLNEAIHFWKQEYSQNATEEASCSHDWVREEKRYAYSIRHLYGLEGAQKNYRAHCCQSLQVGLLSDVFFFEIISEL